jgi:hypothetical protein
MTDRASCAAEQSDDRRDSVDNKYSCRLLEILQRPLLPPFATVRLAECIPAKIFGLFDFVVFEERLERRRRTVIKKNEHLAVGRSFETARSKIQNHCDLFSRQVEPFHNVFYPGSCFEILEDRSDRHARATEDPSTAYLAGYAFNGGALGPIER